MIGNCHRFLTGQTVGDQQHFLRTGGFFNRRHFSHQHFIGIGAARRIKHDHVKAAQLAGLQGALGNIDRVLPVDNRQCFDINLLAQYSQLLHRGRALRIQRRHQDFAFILFGDEFRQLGCRGGFTRPLQADHHKDNRRHRLKRKRLGCAQHIDEPIIDDFDDLLARRNRFQNLRANRFRAQLIKESARHRQSYIGFQKGGTNFAKRRIDVFFRQRAAAAQAVKNRS